MSEHVNTFEPLRLPTNWRGLLKLWDFEPLAYQLAFYKALAGETHAIVNADGTREAARLVMLSAGVRSGKSFGLANIVPAYVLNAQQDCVVAVGGIQHRQASAIFDEVVRLFDEIDVKLGGRPSNREATQVYAMRRPTDGIIKVKVPSGAVVTVLRFSMENFDAVRGQTLALAIVDEIAYAKDGGEDIMGQLRQRVSTTKGQIVLASSPRGLNWFGRAVLDAERIAAEERSGHYTRSVFDPVAFRAPTWSSPFVDLEQVAAEKKRLSSYEFAQNYAAAITTPDTCLFSGFVSCIVRDHHVSKPGGFFTIGLDPATDAGKDFSAVVVLDGQTRRIVHAVRWQRIPTEALVAKVSALADRYEAIVSVDATGIGHVIAGLLRTAGCAIDPVKFTANEKEVMVLSLLAQIERGIKGFQIPDPNTIDDSTDAGHEYRSAMSAMLREFELFQATPKGRGGFSYGVPEGAGNDDLVTACYLALRRAAKSSAPTSQVARKGHTRRTGHHSMDTDPTSRVFAGGRRVGADKFFNQ